jgi:hypothetical protein
MISCTGLEGSRPSKMAFVAGRATVDSGVDGSPSRFIQLDVTKDQVRPNSISISVDIDSVAWLTRRLKTKGTVNLHILPYRKERPPIDVSNHLFVELLWPRLQEDVDSGRLSSGMKHVPLSNIPNTHFATTGRVEGAGNITIFFPRMKHRNPRGRYWETKLPEEIELLWLRNVVYPALERSKSAGLVPYMSHSYEETMWKHVGAQEKTQILGPENLEELQHHIDEILGENLGDESYDCFRSYFFLLGLRGIKTSTSSDDLARKDPRKALTENHPSFDWEYMEESRNGELIIDVGFGFHPSQEKPLVGFWKADVLRLGFDFAGYNQQTSHRVCTIPAIGAINAELSKRRRLRVHIAYRQSYNLVYEVIRGRLTRERTGYFSAESAYHQKGDYVKNIRDMRDAFDRNCGRSFGVRDEYRCRVTALQLLPELVKKVSREMY